MTLKDLSKEFNQWHNAFAPIAELFDPNAPPLQIKLCSTTDWMFYLAATPPVLFGVSKCVKGVNGILRELIETKALIEQLKGKKCSPIAIETLEEEHSNEAKIKLRGLAEKVVDENYQGDDGRKNELKNAMTQSLHTLADKITDGAKLEVRMIAPAPVPSNVEDNQNQEEAVGLTEQQIMANTFDEDIESLCFNGQADIIKALLAPPDLNP